MNEPTTETTPTASALLAAEGGPPYTPGEGEAMRSPATMETAARAGGRREPLERGERILTTLLAALLGSVILGFIAITGQLISMQGEIGGLREEMHEEIGGLRSEMHEEIGGLREAMQEEIGGLREEMREEIGGLREEMREEIGALRTEIGELRSEVGELSERVARIETFLQIRHGPLPGP